MSFLDTLLPFLRPLRPTSPLLTANVTDVKELHILRVIFNNNDITGLTLVALTSCGIGTRKCINVRQGRILPGKFIQQNLITLTCSLSNNCLVHKTSLNIHLIVSTGATSTIQKIPFLCST